MDVITDKSHSPLNTELKLQTFFQLTWVFNHALRDLIVSNFWNMMSSV